MSSSWMDGSWKFGNFRFLEKIEYRASFLYPICHFLMISWKQKRCATSVRSFWRLYQAISSHMDPFQTNFLDFHKCNSSNRNDTSTWPQTGWIGPIGPPREIGNILVIFLSHGLLFETPRPCFFRNHGLFFWTPRQFFPRVMGLFFGP